MAITATQNLPVQAAGILLMITGLGLRAWAAGHIAKNQTLACGGPYRYWRHPLYIGSIIVAAGFGALTGRIETAVIAPLVFAVAYTPLMKHEEALLATLFDPVVVVDWLGSRGRWLPRVVAATSVNNNVAWSRASFMRNAEWQAWIGGVAYCAVCIGMAYWGQDYLP